MPSATPSEKRSLSRRWRNNFGWRPSAKQTSSNQRQQPEPVPTASSIFSFWPWHRGSAGSDSNCADVPHEMVSRDGGRPTCDDQDSSSSAGESIEEHSATEDIRPSLDLGTIVVNFNNVGCSYGTKVLRVTHGCKFHWEGVRKCVHFLTASRGLRVIGVIFENWRGMDGPSDRCQDVSGVPADIAEMCEFIEEVPRIAQNHQRSADDEVTIKLAFRRQCRMLDNDSYRDWKRCLTDRDIRSWLQAHSVDLMVNYFFDSELGHFEILDGNAGETRNRRSKSRRKRSRRRSRQRSRARSPSNRQRSPTADRHRSSPKSSPTSPTSSLDIDSPAQSRPEGREGGNSPAKASPPRGRSRGRGPQNREARKQAVAQRKLHVHGLPRGTDASELQAFMSRGDLKVESAHVDGEGEGDGWVMYSSMAEAKAAMKVFDGLAFHNHVISVSASVGEASTLVDETSSALLMTL